MVQQGRLLAAALAGPDGVEPGLADAILLDLRRRQQARLRVVDASGQAARGLEPHRAAARARATLPSRRRRAPEGWLYRSARCRSASTAASSAARPGSETGEFYSGKEILLGPEVQAALAGATERRPASPAGSGR